MKPPKPCNDGGDCENNLRIVKIESAMRIIKQFANAAAKETHFGLREWMIKEILREATDALK